MKQGFRLRAQLQNSAIFSIACAKEAELFFWGHCANRCWPVQPQHSVGVTSILRTDGDYCYLASLVSHIPLRSTGRLCFIYYVIYDVKTYVRTRYVTVVRRCITLVLCSLNNSKLLGTSLRINRVMLFLHNPLTASQD